MNAVDGAAVVTVEASTADEARERAEKIRLAIDGTWQLIKTAYERRDWHALGYGSWDDYCQREYGAARLRLPREERQEVVGSLRDAGLSIRAIASATGNDRNTVRSDWRQVGEFHPPERELTDEGEDEEPPPLPKPPKVTGTDGKTYRAAPNPKPRRAALKPQVTKTLQRLLTEAQTLETLARDDRFTDVYSGMPEGLQDAPARVYVICNAIQHQMSTQKNGAVG